MPVVLDPATGQYFDTDTRQVVPGPGAQRAPAGGAQMDEALKAFLLSQQQKEVSPVISGAERAKLEAVLARQQGAEREVNLKPLAALVDAWTGSNFAPATRTPEEEAIQRAQAQSLRAKTGPQGQALQQAKHTMNLRQEYNNINTTKESRVVDASWERIKQAANEPTGMGRAAADVALLFNYMKLLDPGSVVREGEFWTIQSARGVPDQIKAWLAKAERGETLTPEQRVGLMRAAEKQRMGQMTAQGEVDRFYTDIAKSMGVDTRYVIPSRQEDKKSADDFKASMKAWLKQSIRGK